MTGEELYQKISQRDYSGSDDDQYAQLLKTLYYNLMVSGQEQQFFKLLETAQKNGKKITVLDGNQEEFTITSLSLA